MLVDIGGVHMWDGAKVGDLMNSTARLRDLPGVAIGSKTPVPVSSYFGGQKIGQKTAKALKDWFGYHDRLVLDEDANVHQQIQEASTASVSIYDELAELEFEQGQEIIIRRDDQSILYGGVITDATRSLAAIYDNSGVLTYCLQHKINSSDYQSLAHEKILNKAYTAPTGGDIARDVLALLYSEGIREGLIMEGELLEDQGFPMILLDEAMDRICKLCGYQFFITETKLFYFIPYTAYPAAWDIEDGTEILQDGLDVVDANSEYVNVAYVNNINAQTTPKTQTFLADGVAKSWPLGFPLAEAPTVLVGGVEMTVGQKESGTSYDFYWAENDNILLQDQDADPVANGTIITVNYLGYYQGIVKVKRPAEITRNKLARGFGTGEVQAVYSDASIHSIDAGIEFASAKLADYARKGRQIHYKTDTPGLAAGVLQDITIPQLNLPLTQGLLVSMDIDFSENMEIYSIEAAEGPVDPSWLKVMSHIASYNKEQATQEASTDEIVQGLEEESKVWTNAMHPNPFISVVCDGIATPASVDFPCLADEDKLKYVVLYSGGVEFFRKPIADQTIGDTEILTIALILSGEANGTAISHVGLWGGFEATDTPGSGIEMSKFSFIHTKTSLEALEFLITDSKGW